MVQIWDEGGGSGETTNTKNALDEKELQNNGAAVAAWWTATTGNTIEQWNALGHDEKVSEAGKFRELFGRGAGWVDVEEPVTPGDGDPDPPDGTEEIVKHVDDDFMGHRVRVWSQGLMLKIQVGEEVRIMQVGDVNVLVQVMAKIRQVTGAVGF